MHLLQNAAMGPPVSDKFAQGYEYGLYRQFNSMDEFLQCVSSHGVPLRARESDNAYRAQVPRAPGPPGVRAWARRHPHETLTLGEHSLLQGIVKERVESRHLDLFCRGFTFELTKDVAGLQT